MSELKEDEVASARNTSHELADPDSSQIFKNLEQFTAKIDNSAVSEIAGFLKA